MNIISKIRIGLIKYPYKLMGNRPQKLYMGVGSSVQIGDIAKSINAYNVLLVTGKTVGEFPSTEKIKEQIKSKGLNLTHYSGVTPDPTFLSCDNIAYECRKNNIQCIVALGGGSVMDACKVAACAHSMAMSSLKLNGILKVSKKNIFVIAVPTTAGSGAEVTCAAVISQTSTKKKGLVFDPKLTPEAVVLDPILTLTTPVSIMIETAMDALSHSLESALGTFMRDNGSYNIDRCIENILTSLCDCIDNPVDIELREKIQLGAYYGGKSLLEGNVGYIHAFAHSLGSRYNVSHGRAITIMMIPILKFYKDKSYKRLARLYDILYPNSTLSLFEKSDNFIHILEEIIKKSDISLTIDNFAKSDIDKVINDAFAECHGTYPVPQYMSKTEAKEILDKISV